MAGSQCVCMVRRRYLGTSQSTLANHRSFAPIEWHLSRCIWLLHQTLASDCCVRPLQVHRGRLETVCRLASLSVARPLNLRAPAWLWASSDAIRIFKRSCNFKRLGLQQGIESLPTFRRSFQIHDHLQFREIKLNSNTVSWFRVTKAFRRFPFSSTRVLLQKSHKSFLWKVRIF